MAKDCTGKGIKLIAITGPSASGKSTLAKKLARELGKKRCVLICQDDYYRDWSYLAKHERKKINFDDAKVFDLTLLAKHIGELKKGNCIRRPCYCFIQSKRLAKKETVSPKPIVILEGLTLLFDKQLQRMVDYGIYIDTDNATCLARRLKRDITERGETIELVCNRYFNHVLPMQKKYVEKQKRWADVVVDGRDCKDTKTIKRIVKLIRSS